MAKEDTILEIPVEYREDTDEIILDVKDFKGVIDVADKAQFFAPGTFTLQSKEFKGWSTGFELGQGSLSSDSLASFMLGLVSRKFTGSISIDVSVGQKKIFFSEGEIVFAASNVMDDRLGEILYRFNKITLDQLTESAVRVDRKNKFGQVLLNANIFKALDLWSALKLQVTEIVKSVFTYDFVSFEISRSGAAPTQVVFENGTRDLIEECHGYGLMFRSYKERVSGENALTLNESIDATTLYEDGSFLRGFCELIEKSKNIAALLNESKLSEDHTLGTLMTLQNSNIVMVSGQKPRKSYTPDGASVLKSKVDAFNLLSNHIKTVMQGQGLTIPVSDLKAFVDISNPVGANYMYLSDDLMLSSDSLKNMFDQLEDDRSRVEYFSRRLSSVTQFYIQVVSDILPYEAARGVKDKYRELI